MIKFFIKVFSRKEKQKIIFITVIQIATALMDLLGVAIIGLMATMSSQVLTSNKFSTSVTDLLKILGITNFTFYQQLILLSCISMLVLTLRTILSIYMTKKIFRIFGIKASKITSNLLEKIFSRPISVLHSKNITEMTFAITKGVESIAIGVAATSVVVVADLSILVLLISVLFIYEPLVAGIMTLLLGVSTYYLLRFLRASAARYSTDAAILENESNRKIGEIFQSYKVLVPRYTFPNLIKSIEDLRVEYSRKQSRIELLPYASKYVIELAILFGAMLIGFLAVTYFDSKNAIMMTVIFLASGSRIAPALLRFQQGILLVRSSVARGKETINLIGELDAYDSTPPPLAELEIEHKDFVGSIELCDLKYTFPGSNNHFINGISLSILAGSKVAIIGPSGAGKSTLLDLILGIIEPNSGSVLISNMNPRAAMEKWPGAISYIPQETFLTQDSLLMNLAMGYAINSESISLAEESLTAAQLDVLIEKLNATYFEGSTDFGVNLSGGEKQRLGIARALFSRPRIIVLDEATSSLDHETERKVLEMIDDGLLRGVTLLVVTHNISTVVNSDVVIYLEHGRVVSEGTFAQVSSEVQNLAKQANLSPM
jgi:ABC-type multidrug transport system fused ATPase/permease subunit